MLGFILPGIIDEPGWTGYLEDKSVMQVCLEMKVLPKEKLEQILDPSKQI